MNGTMSDSVLKIHKWWTQLQDNRAARAGLRRAGSLQQVLTHEAAYDLARKLGATTKDMPTVGLIAAVLSYVREDTPDVKVARALGAPQEQPLCSRLRFQRLIEAEEGNVQLTTFRRTLTLLSNKANVKDLAASLLQWNIPALSDRCRQTWLYDYFQTDNPGKDPS